MEFFEENNELLKEQNQNIQNKEQVKANNAKSWAPSLPSFMQCEEIASKSVSLQLPADVYAEIARLAEAEGKSISGKATEVVSEAIARKYKPFKKKPDNFKIVIKMPRNKTVRFMFREGEYKEMEAMCASMNVTIPEYLLMAIGTGLNM